MSANIKTKAKSWDGIVVGWLTVAHVGALAAPFVFSWSGLAIFLTLYFVTASLGIGLGFHRFLTHRSLSLPRWLGYLLAIFGTLALEGSPITWVAHHRMHHGGSDTARDPHDASRGFWFSHMGWLLRSRPEFDAPTRLNRFAWDIVKDPFLVWLSRPVVMIGLQVVLGLSLLALGGFSWLVWGVFLRMVCVYHVTWLVNSAAHMWGYRNYRTADLATNNWWVGLLSFGEGWHNNHHGQPEAVHVQHRWWELDVTGWVARGLAAVGLAWDLKMPIDLPAKQKTRKMAAPLPEGDAAGM